jgi:L-ascorbate metabolism protein UlaG (beta-lactamase superfamily)
MRITLIGGSAALLEIGGFRLLTDPTFDQMDGEYGSWQTRLSKTAGPAGGAANLGPIDAVLQSHDQHADNLDHSGREFLSHVRTVFTTPAGAERLKGKAVGLAPWEAVEFKGGCGEVVEITGTPGWHGPP